MINEELPYKKELLIIVCLLLAAGLVAALIDILGINLMLIILGLTIGVGGLVTLFCAVWAICAVKNVIDEEDENENYSQKVK